MSNIHLIATKIVITTHKAWLILDGTVSENTDFPIGTVLAYDADDNLFVYKHTNWSAEELGKKSMWPRAEKGEIKLFRDYWTYIQAGADTPYGASARNAGHKVLREIG